MKKSEQFAMDFATTNNARTLQDIINTIESEMNAELKVNRIAYRKECAAAEGKGYDIPKMNRIFEQANITRRKADKEVAMKYADRLENAKKNYADALQNFTKKVEGNNAWNDIAHRKDAPKILENLEKSVNGLTEDGMEIAIHDEILGKQNRYSFPIQSMEKLGWLTRTGSGNPGDAKVSHLTDEGKRQLDYFRKYKMFDASNIA